MVLCCVNCVPAGLNNATRCPLSLAAARFADPSHEAQTRDAPNGPAMHFRTCLQESAVGRVSQGTGSCTRNPILSSASPATMQQPRHNLAGLLLRVTPSWESRPT
jgi:hypothetical protein